MSGAFSKLQSEVHQAHDLRKPLLEAIQKLRGGRALISFFNRFYGDYPLSQADADILEEILCNTDCSKGVTLIVDAPGGDGLAAERIIQVCRSYSGLDFETIVPARAKSAATMVCLGADRILMSPTSELGPIDPQVYKDVGGRQSTWVAAYHITKAYDDLFNAAVALTAGKIEPYLQQLGKFNAAEIHDLKASQSLSEMIAVSSLQKGMMKGKLESDIKKMIGPFIDPLLTMSHGRAINHEAAKHCGLTVEIIPLNGELWKNVWDLYMRSKYVVESTNICKLVDTPEASYNVNTNE